MQELVDACPTVVINRPGSEPESRHLDCSDDRDEITWDGDGYGVGGYRGNGYGTNVYAGDAWRPRRRER